MLKSKFFKLKFYFFLLLARICPFRAFFSIP
ncbi:hypothetical protein SAMN05216436_117115, partial [bacterium A37T11]